MDTRIDEVADGIYRISTMAAPFGITFNQFLIDDDEPTLIHTGEHESFERVRGAIREVLDPARLRHVVLLHWEGDENGGMDRFLAEARDAQLVGSHLSIELNARGFGVTSRVQGFKDGERLEIGRHTLRFLETPHVHHWDSMMVFEESTQTVFPADLFLQPGDVTPVVDEDLSDAMLQVYRQVGIFAHENPVREAVERIAALDPALVHAMHGGSITREALPAYVAALREREFAYCGKLLGRDIREVALEVAS